MSNVEYWELSELKDQVYNLQDELREWEKLVLNLKLEIETLKKRFDQEFTKLH